MMFLCVLKVAHIVSFNMNLRYFVKFYVQLSNSKYCLILQYTISHLIQAKLADTQFSFSALIVTNRLPSVPQTHSREQF